jgi:hypothetical protein
VRQSRTFQLSSRFSAAQLTIWHARIHTTEPRVECRMRCKLWRQAHAVGGGGRARYRVDGHLLPRVFAHMLRLDNALKRRQQSRDAHARRAPLPGSSGERAHAGWERRRRPERSTLPALTRMLPAAVPRCSPTRMSFPRARPSTPKLLVTTDD